MKKLHKLPGGVYPLGRREQKTIKGGIQILNPCNPYDYACQDIYRPVLCSDGNVYGNYCYATLNCQYDCMPLGAELM
jgi:hypothetical protein